MAALGILLIFGIIIIACQISPIIGGILLFLLVWAMLHILLMKTE